VYIGDRIVYVLLLGVGCNAMVTFWVSEVAALRHWSVFLAWAVLGGVCVLIEHLDPRAPWRTLLGLQLGYVAVAWAWLGCC